MIEYKVCVDGAIVHRTGCCEGDPLCASGRPLLSCPGDICAYGTCPAPVCEEDAGSCGPDADAGA